VGGDYYDFLPYPDNRVGVVIGDVAGKGMPAALMMTSLQAKVQALAETPGRPGVRRGASQPQPGRHLPRQPLHHLLLRHHRRLDTATSPSATPATTRLSWSAPAAASRRSKAAAPFSESCPP
jgi:hypothetical protein